MSVWVRAVARRRARPLLAVAVVALAACADYYDGPPSDHFDGERFFNPGKRSDKGFLDFLHWQLTADRGPWPEAVPRLHRAVPPSRVDGGALRVTFVGHATVLLQTRGLNILTDPVWSARASPVSWAGPERVHEPGIAFEALPPIDAVVVSHNHYDHLDLDTLERLWRRDRPRIVVPLGNDAIIEDRDPDMAVRALDWGERVALSDAVGVALAPLQHWSARGLFDRNEALWGAFVLTTPDGAVYFAGDTGYGEGRHFRRARQRYGSIRLALLPIGAYEPRWFMRYQHMNPDEAVRAHGDLDAERSLAIHFGTFRLADNGYAEPLRDLRAARRSRGVAPTVFRTLRPGELWVLDAPASPAGADADGSS